VRERRTVESLLETIPAELRGTVVGAEELLRRRNLEPEGTLLPTGISAIDRVLGGGLPRGVLVELTGRGSSGRLAVVLAAVASMTSRGGSAALVDRGGSLDPDSAARLGVVLSRVLWVIPRRLPEAVRAAEELLSAGFPLVAMEAGLPPLSGRVATAAWIRLARLARGQGATVLVSSPYRLSGPAASVVLRLRGLKGVWRGTSIRVLAGLDASVVPERLRGVTPGSGGLHRWLLPDAALADPEAVPAIPSHQERVHAAG